MSLSWTRDNDYVKWPFLFAKSKYSSGISIVLNSGGTETSGRGATLRLTLYNYTFMMAVPQFLAKPYNKKYETFDREYGFHLYKGYLNLRYGAQTWDAGSAKERGWFLPWTQWRLIERQHLSPSYKIIKSFSGNYNWEEEYKFRKKLPTVNFQFIDSDGEKIDASCRIERIIYGLGIGYFKWLSYLIPKSKLTYMEIEYSNEVGEEKGSWKGGIIGCSIEMKDGESMESAFKRHCEKEGLIFNGYKIHRLGAIRGSTK